MCSANSPEEKREWLKDIKRIIKDYQKQAYAANKDGLLKGISCFIRNTSTPNISYSVH